MNSLYRPDIDGLRAIAILTVVLYHAGIPGFSGGFVGVDVFFVISGFLITRLLSDELKRTGKISFKDFYARRFRRLLPALALVVLATQILWAVFLPGLGDTRKFALSVRWSLIGLANVFFKRNTGGYFDGPTAEMPLLHLWSLAVEEQFYLFWPLLLAFLGKNRRRTTWAMALISLASLATAQAMIAHAQSTSAFYLMPYRAWELGIGALVFFLNPKPRKNDLPTAILGLGLIAASTVLFTSATPFPGLSALLPVLGTALVLASPNNPLAKNALANPAMVRIGILSYGWYLWHWPLLALAKVWNLGVEPPPSIRLALLALSLGLAQLSLSVFEAPIRHGKFWKKLAPSRVIAGGAFVSACLIAAALGVSKLETRVLSLHLGQELVHQVGDRSPLGVECFDKSVVGSDKCNYSFTDGVPKATLAVWGDSHSCSYFPLIEDYARDHHLKVVQYCQGNTPPLLEGPPHVTGQETDPVGLPNFNEAVFWDLKRKLAAPATYGPISIVLAARWMAYSGRKPIATETHTGFLDAAQTPEGSLAELKRRLRLSLAELTQVGVKRVLVMLPYPEFPSFVLRCLQRTPGRCATSRDDLEHYRGDVAKAIRQVVAEFKNARAIDPVPVVCDAASCPQVFQGMPVVSDDNHPSLSAVRKVAAVYQSDIYWLTH